MKDLIIVGGGPAGLTAGLYAMRAGLSCTLYEKQFVGGQAATTNEIENYPGFPGGIGGPELSMQMAEQAQNMGLDIQYDEVTALSLRGEVKTVHLGMRSEQAKSVILCMGAMPRLLGVAGEDRFRGRGVSYCATCDGAFYKGKDVAVIGGGDTAAEDALYLSRFAHRVTVIHRRDQFRAARHLVLRMEKTENINILYDTVVDEIVGSEKINSLSLRNARTQETTVQPVDGVFVAVGILPLTELVKGELELDAGGYIVAGEDTRTSEACVYAAGDVRTKPLRQVICAASDGAVALTMAQGDIL